MIGRKPKRNCHGYALADGCGRQNVQKVRCKNINWCVELCIVNWVTGEKMKNLYRNVLKYYTRYLNSNIARDCGTRSFISWFSKGKYSSSQKVGCNAPKEVFLISTLQRINKRASDEATNQQSIFTFFHCSQRTRFQRQADGSYSRTHISQPLSFWFCCKSQRAGRGRCGNVWFCRHKYQVRGFSMFQNIITVLTSTVQRIKPVYWYFAYINLPNAPVAER